MRFGWDPPSSDGPRMVIAEGGPKIFKLKYSWRQRRRSKIIACQPQTLEGEEGGRGPAGGNPLLGCTAVPIHPCLSLYIRVTTSEKWMGQQSWPNLEVGSGGRIFFVFSTHISIPHHNPSIVDTWGSLVPHRQAEKNIQRPILPHLCPPHMSLSPRAIPICHSPSLQIARPPRPTPTKTFVLF